MIPLTSCPGSGCIVSNVTVGSNNTFGGIYDGPLLDSTFQTVLRNRCRIQCRQTGCILQETIFFPITPVQWPQLSPRKAMWSAGVGIPLDYLSCIEVTGQAAGAGD